MGSRQSQPPAGATSESLRALSRLSGLKRRRKRLIGAGAAAVLLAAGGVIWSNGPWSGRSRQLNDFTVVAERGSLPGVITASGELEAIRRVNVSPKRAGLVKELFVDEGDVVEKGQVLARMDAGDFQDRIDELTALERQANADYEAKRADYLRHRQLLDIGAISASDLDGFRAAFISSKEALNAARERIEQRQVEGSEKLIRAPFSGVITERFAEPGSFVTPTTAASTSAGATSSTLVELSEGLEVAAKVPESDIGRIRVGQNATVRVDSFPDQLFPARVRDIAPRALKTDNVISFEVELTLIDPPPTLRIGMTADVNFQTGRTAASTLVPTVAIVTEKGQSGVLLVGKDEEPTFQPVQLGASSGDRSAILSGVKPGTRVFIDLPPWAKQRD
ncbi:efflux RND transporter periplasmic adaptor subunit [Synechococcus sp. MIT S9503]|uniref:efflux RND transporter periplasmic adaptor subunit n=1 Tax=Synechococcus sp. MIT S9503 TaxID=3082547 RepID=UPI0039A72185